MGEENEQVVRVYGHISEGSLAGQAAQLARSGVRFAPASASATGGAERVDPLLAGVARCR